MAENFKHKENYLEIMTARKFVETMATIFKHRRNELETMAAIFNQRENELETMAAIF